MNFKIENFEGPLDLLYSLLQKNKFEIKDIPIAEITEQYLAELEKMKELDMENMSEFLVMASELLKIKSRMLLPKDSDEEQEDPRESLIERLLEYKRYKDAAEQLCLLEENNKVLIKGVNDIPKYITIKRVDPDEVLSGITIEQLTQEFQKILKVNKNKIDKVRHDFKSVKRDVYTVEQKKNHIIQKIIGKKKISFIELFADDAQKMEKVVTFLALLELIKIRKITIEQKGMFGEIELTIVAEQLQVNEVDEYNANKNN